jgi:polar amino acid transport system substrate-binding protein/arginine/ornithine transport system substrate-binding protein
MIPALKVRKFDAIVASMTITDERRKVVEFTDSYYDVPSRWIAPVDGVTAVDPESLKGKRIIVLRNSPRARYVLDRYKDSDVLQTGSETDVYRELLAGRGDIALGSSVVSGEALLKRPEGRGFRQIGPMVPLGEGVGIAVRKGDFALRDRFNAALKAIRADGSYAKLERRYFDFEISGAAH